MSVLRFVGLMLMGSVPLLLVVARVAFGRTTRSRLLLAARFLGLGASTVLLSFQELGDAFRGAGSVLMGLSLFGGFPTANGGYFDDVIDEPTRASIGSSSSSPPDAPLDSRHEQD